MTEDKKKIKELKDELKFQKYRADKLDDALWELTSEVNREDKLNGVGSSLRAAQISAERLMAHLVEKQHERETTTIREKPEKPVVD